MASALPDAPFQRTHSGGHFFVRAPEGIVLKAETKVEILEGVKVDLRVAGLSQVVVEPSRHVSGGYYSFERSLPTDLRELPECPPLIVEAIRASRKATQDRNSSDLDAEEFAAGERNNRLFRLGCRLRQGGLQQHEIRMTLEAVNECRCKPPLDLGEVEQIAESAARYEVVTNDQVGDLGDQSGEWPEPIDFRSPALPEFPIDALPQGMREVVEAISLSMGNPPDMAAQVAIGISSFAVSRLIAVEIKKRHLETANIMAGVIAPPGGSKTPTLRVLEGPLRRWQQETREALTPEIVSAQAVYDAKIAEAEKALKAASNIEDDTEREIARREAADLKGQLALEARPEIPRWITSDFSSAGLAIQMPAAGMRMISINDEGSVLFHNMLGKQSSNNSSEIGFFATLFNGGGFDESRVSREGVNLEEARLSVVCMIQPDILKSLKGIQELRDQGVLDRFVWCRTELPVAPADTPEIPDAAMRGYEDTLTRLLNLRPFDPAAVSHSQEGLQLDRQAREIRASWIEGLNDRIRDGDLDTHRGGVAKLRANVERLAGVFHMVKYPNKQAYMVPISSETFEAATRVGDYWLAHMLGLHAMLGLDRGVSIAERIVGWITRQMDRGALPDGSFSQRDLFQGLKRYGGSVQKVGDLGDGLCVLEEHFFLRRKPQGRSVLFELNPRAFSRGRERSPVDGGGDREFPNT
jgi:hypothetical protein